MLRRTVRRFGGGQFVVLLALALAGCGETESRQPVFEGVFGEPSISTPAPPQLTPCPSGWRELSEGALTRCEPDPATRAPRLTTWQCPAGWQRLTSDGHPGFCAPREPAGDCPDGARVELATGVCLAVGSACPVGSFPDDTLSDPSALFVRAGSFAGNGTSSAPFGSITAALSVAAPNQVIVVASGTYAERLDVRQSVTLRGACASGVELVGPALPAEDPANNAYQGTLHVTSGATLTLRDVGITGPRSAITLVNATLDVDGVWIHDATNIALRAERSTVTARDVLVQRMASPTPDGDITGRGIDIRDASTASFDGLEVNDCFGVGLRARDVGTTLDASRVRIARCNVSVGIYEGSEVTLRELLITDSGKLGVQVSDPGTVATLEDVRVRDTEVEYAPERFPLIETELGMAIAVAGEATLSVDRAYLTGSRQAAMTLFSSATVSDVVITDPIPAATFDGAAAVLVDDAAVTVRRMLSARTSEVAVRVKEGATATIQASRITANTAPAGVGASAVAVFGGAALSLEAVDIEDNDVAAIVASEAGTRVEGTDVVIRGTRARPLPSVDDPEVDEILGTVINLGDTAAAAFEDLLLESNERVGFAVLTGSSLTLTHARLTGQTAPEGTLAMAALVDGEGSTLVASKLTIDGVEGAGLVAYNQGRVELSDGAISGTRDGAGFVGIALGAGLGGTLSVERTVLTRIAGGALLADGEGAHVAARDLRIASVATTSNGTFGYGAMALGGGTLELERTEIDEVTTAGVMAFSSSVTVTDSRIRNVRAGSYLNDLIVWAVDGVGEGVIALDDSTVDLTNVEVSNVARAAVLYDDSGGVIGGLAAHDSPFALIVQGSRRPSNAELVPGAPAGKLPVPRTAPVPMSADSAFGRLTRGSAPSTSKAP